MNIEFTEVFGFRAALRGMRNPMNSWDKRDSIYSTDSSIAGSVVRCLGDMSTHWPEDYSVPELPMIGPNDMQLCLRLIKGGSEHRKFMRMIFITVDFVIPREVWQEMDTYKVCTVRNSCSTMHKLGHTSLTVDDFEDGSSMISIPEFAAIVDKINEMGEQYRETKNYELVRIMKHMIPESFIQRATFAMNYETAITMFMQRWNHRLPQWRVGETGSICSWIHSLPYMAVFLEAATGEKLWKKIQKKIQE